MDQSSSSYITVFEMYVTVAVISLTQQTMRDTTKLYHYAGLDYSFFPDRLTPAFVACSSNATLRMEGLGA